MQVEGLESIEVATGERLSRLLRAPPLRPPSPHYARLPSPHRRKEERDDSGKKGAVRMTGEAHMGPTFLLLFFVCETDMWGPPILLFFWSKLPRKRHASATSDKDRVKIAT